jgi:NAD+ synthase (glutamine-hydrolysing)
MGDCAGNAGIIVDTLQAVAQEKPDLLVFSELFIQGYPPRDLLEHPWFIAKGSTAVEELCKVSRDFPKTGILFGSAMPNTLKHGKGLYNAAVLICNGSIVFQQNKSLLPTYDVFDETRYFDPADTIDVVRFKDQTLGITICEDAWCDTSLWPSTLYNKDPVDILVRKAATLLINISGSPFHMGKIGLRYDIMRRHAVHHHRPFIFVNQVGGNDDLVFDGNSIVFDNEGSLRGHINGFSQGHLTIDTSALPPKQDAPEFDTITSVHDALVLGLRDYFYKCGFKRALVGLSGGIDSAVTCALAVEALGKDNVYGVTMPSRYSSEGSVDDSRKLARNLGIEFKEIAIEAVFTALLDTMKEHFSGKKPDVTEENMQARIRGTILMALSNKFGCLLLSTGNKSEMAVGYCTLYGDMNGGLSVISDLPKTKIYQVARYINREKEIIPSECITKPPSAELRPDQKDQDTLPPYDVLDKILAALIEEGKSRAETIALGIDEKTVDWVIRAIRLNEYKRRQAAPGLKMTPKAFGSGRRFPIAAKYDFSE